TVTGVQTCALPILPIRKAGKLPKPAAAVSYSLEYGTATIEGPDVLDRGERVLLVDDILATGGTLTAAQSLVADLGAEVIGSAVVLELPELAVAGSPATSTRSSPAEPARSEQNPFTRTGRTSLAARRARRRNARRSR